MRPSPNSAAASDSGTRRKASNSPLASLDVPRFEECFGQLDARWQVVRRDRQCLLEPRRRVGVPGKALQHDRVEIGPVERSRRQRLGAGVRLVRGVPLLPRVQHAR